MDDEGRYGYLLTKVWANVWLARIGRLGGLDALIGLETVGRLKGVHDRRAAPLQRCLSWGRGA